MGAIKITPADVWFSKCIRERNNWTCEYKGTQYPDAQMTKSALGLHCSHYRGRGNWAVRFDPMNAFAHSHGSHRLLGSDPVKFQAWVIGQLGQTQYDILIESSNCKKRGREYRKANRGRGKNNALVTHYKTEFQRMCEMRADGETGRIDFVAFV